MEEKTAQLIFEPLLVDAMPKQARLVIEFQANVETQLIAAMTEVLVEALQRERKTDERKV